MKHTEAEILDALEVIKNVCGEYHDVRCCGSICPFSYEERCFFDEGMRPSEWTLNDGVKMWRAFK